MTDSCHGILLLGKLHYFENFHPNIKVNLIKVKFVIRRKWWKFTDTDFLDIKTTLHDHLSSSVYIHTVHKKIY